MLPHENLSSAARLASVRIEKNLVHPAILLENSMTQARISRQRRRALSHHLHISMLQVALLGFTPGLALSRSDTTEPIPLSKMRYVLAWEAEGEEVVCRALRRSLNSAPVPTGCVSATPEATCPFNDLALAEQPGFSAPDWARVVESEQEKVLRALSDFRAGPAADGSPERREWQWKNQYGPIFGGATERGTMELLVARFDVNNDGTDEWVRRVEVSPLDPHPFLFQAAFKGESLEYDRSIWDEASDWSPFFFNNTTYWLSWSTVIGRSDPKYLTRDAVSYAFVAALRGDIGRVRLNEYTYKCVYAIKEIR